MTQYTKSNFCLDSLPEKTFSGYPTGDIWNGFACPLFSQDEAEKILNASKANGYLWKYSAELDAYTVSHNEDPEDYEPEVFEAQEIIIHNSRLKVYPVGAYSWTWSICN